MAAFKDRAKPDIETGVKEIAKGTARRGDPHHAVQGERRLHQARADARAVDAQMVSNSFPGASPLAKELGKDGAGVIVATVVPPPTKRSLPIVQEYQAAIEKQLGKKEYSFTSLESYIGAKVTVEALRRAGPKPTREAFMRALDGMQELRHRRLRRQLLARPTTTAARSSS